MFYLKVTESIAIQQFALGECMGARPLGTGPESTSVLTNYSLLAAAFWHACLLTYKH